MSNGIHGQPVFMSTLAAFVVVASSLCFPAAGGPGTEDNGGKAVERGSAPAFTGVSLRVQDAVIPPGGMFQFQLMLTEPKPIGHGSTRPNVPSGPVRGIALNDPTGQTAGVAIVDSSGIRINFNSPAATFGTNPNSDYPILTIAMPIPADTPVGRQFPLSIDRANSFWFDAAGQPYPQEIKNGALTIGGTLAISDVVPNGGVQPAGTKISILGTGFRPDSRVDIEGVEFSAGNLRFVSPNEIDLILPLALQMDGIRVRVRNDTQRITYFSYFRSQAVGKSTHPLLAQTYPLFARKTYTDATLPWTRSASLFTGLAVQNPGMSDASITVEMQSAAGNALGSLSFSLPVGSKITRDLLEFFAGVPAEATSVRIRSNVPVQILGLLGDDATGDVVPVILSAP
jgi:hypothetical protein